MSRNVDSIATPLVRGVLGALSSLGIALAVVVVPALAAQVVGSGSGATALDAIIIALNVLVLGHGGGIMLSTGVIDGAVTLTPFGLLLLVVMLSALAMRRVGRALRPVRDDGVLREGALRDSGSALGMYAVVYAIGLAVLAGIGRSADSSPMVTSAVVSGLMVAVIGGVIGLLWSLRREPTDSVPGVRVLDLLPAPYGEIARAALLAVTGLLGLGMGVVVVMMLVSVPAQSALFDGLAPGIVGGFVLTLIQLALLPLVAVWALTVMLGGTIGVGTATGISLGGSETGVLPALPILGALPGPGEFPAVTWALLILPALPVALGALRLVRDTAAFERRDRITAWVAYPITVIVACLLLAGLSTGGIGDGRLVHLGPQMSTLALPLIGLVAISSGLVIAVFATPLIPWARATGQSLRERVEASERSEGRSERGSERSSAGAEGPVDDTDDAEVDADVTPDVGEPTAADEPAGAVESVEPDELVELDVSDDSDRPDDSDVSDVSDEPDEPDEPVNADADVDPEADAWALDADDLTDPAPEEGTPAEGVEEQPAGDPSQRRSWLSRRTDR